MRGTAPLLFDLGDDEAKSAMSARLDGAGTTLTIEFNVHFGDRMTPVRRPRVPQRIVVFAKHAIELLGREWKLHIRLQTVSSFLTDASAPMSDAAIGVDGVPIVLSIHPGHRFDDTHKTTHLSSYVF